MPQSDLGTLPPKKRRNGKRLEREERERAQATFLDAFATSANMRAACKVAGVSRTTVYNWQEHDEAFSFRYKQAEADANDVIRAAIYTRAVNGVDKPLHYQGRLVTDAYGRAVTVKEYSDTLLIFLAKARMPEFREKQQVDISATLDITGLAAAADAIFHTYLARATPGGVLVPPDASAEG